MQKSDEQINERFLEEFRSGKRELPNPEKRQAYKKQLALEKERFRKEINLTSFAVSKGYEYMHAESSKDVGRLVSFSAALGIGAILFSPLAIRHTEACHFV